MGSAARRHKAEALLRDGRVALREATPERIHFDVKDYSVIYHRRERHWSCTCPYSTLTEGDCYHILAAQMLLRERLRGAEAGRGGEGSGPEPGSGGEGDEAGADEFNEGDIKGG